MLQSITQYYIVLLQSVTECYRVLESITKTNLAHLLGPIFGLVYFGQIHFYFYVVMFFPMIFYWPDPFLNLFFCNLPNCRAHVLPEYVLREIKSLKNIELSKYLHI